MPIAAGDAAPVEPTLDSIRKNAYRPLSRPLFIYLSKKALERPEVQTFATFYITEAAKLSAEVGYIPLPDKAYTLGRERIDKRTLGTMFGAGVQHVGLSIEDLLQREQTPR